MSWSGQDICRVYSMHKQNQFVDIKHGKAVQSFAFDNYGQFLMTSDESRIQVFYFRDFTAAIATINEPASFVTFDITCTNIIASYENKVKLIAAPH